LIVDAIDWHGISRCQDVLAVFGRGRAGTSVKLLVMTYVLALLAGIVGAAVGFAAGAAVAAALAPALGITSFEGASGYFAVFIGGPVGGVMGLVLGGVFALRRAGHRGFAAIGGRLTMVAAGVVGVGAATLAAFWIARPIMNANGPSPQLVFEIRLPPGATPSTAAGYAIELQTSKNQMPGRLENPRQEDGRTVFAGSVELYFRVWQRMLVLKTPDKTDVLWSLSFGLSPGHAKSFGGWQAADYIGEPGKDEARRATKADRYEIRYRMDWAGED
jgi:hypothetical protein